MVSKFKDELCLMTLKKDKKLDRELTCRFNIDIKNLTNSDPSTRKSQKFSL